MSSFMTSTLSSSNSREPCVATASSNRSIHLVNVLPYWGIVTERLSLADHFCDQFFALTKCNLGDSSGGPGGLVFLQNLRPVNIESL